MQANKPVMDFFEGQTPSARRALLPLGAFPGLACPCNIAIGIWLCAVLGLGRRS